MGKKPTLFKSKAAKGAKKQSRKGYGTITQVRSVNPEAVDNGDSDEESVFPVQGEFAGMEVETHPDLEKKGRAIGKAQDEIKTLQTKIKENKALALLIMKENDIRTYDKHGVHLRINTKEDLEVEID